MHLTHVVHEGEVEEEEEGPTFRLRSYRSRPLQRADENEVLIEDVVTFKVNHTIVEGPTMP